MTLSPITVVVWMRARSRLREIKISLCTANFTPGLAAQNTNIRVIVIGVRIPASDRKDFLIGREIRLLPDLELIVHRSRHVVWTVGAGRVTSGLIIGATN